MRIKLFTMIVTLASVAVTAIQGAEPAPATDTGQFKFPQHIGPDCDNLFVLGDAIPPLRRLFASETYRRFAAEGVLARQKSPRGVDLAAMPTRLEAISQYIPVEVAIGFPSADYDHAIELARFGLAIGLCAGATSAGGASVESDLPKLQAVALQAVQSFEMPKLSIWVGFRNEQVPSLAFAWIAAMAPQATEQSGIEVEVSGNTLNMYARLGDAFADEGIAEILSELGVAASPDDPKLAEIVAVLANLEFDIWIEQIGDGLCVTIGNQADASAPYPGESLGTLWSSDRPLIAFGKWNIARLKAGSRDLAQMWNEWRESATGQATVRLDEEDVLGDLNKAIQDIDRASETLSFQVTATDSVEVVIHETGFSPVESLTSSPIVRLLPEDSEYIEVDARKSFATHLADALIRFEDRLATRQMQQEMSGRDEQASQLERVSQFYYERLRTFRRFVFDEAPTEFAQSIAVLVSSHGKIDQLEVGFDAEDGQKNLITVSEAPIGEYAAIGRLAKPSQPLAVFNRASRLFLEAFRDDVPETLIGPQDLGLGVETHAYTANPFAGPPRNLTISVTGDMTPHFFVVNDWLVVSTSIRLSKSILAAWKEPSKRLKVPDSQHGGLTGFGVIPGETVARCFDQLWVLFTDAVAGKGSVRLVGPISNSIRNPERFRSEDFLGFSEFIRLLDRIDWTTIDDDKLRRTRATVTFAKYPSTE